MFLCQQQACDSFPYFMLSLISLKTLFEGVGKVRLGETGHKITFTNREVAD